MTAAIQIDTLAFAKKLKEAGADERLADAIVEGITAADTSNLVTKEDLSKVETRLKEEIADVRLEIQQASNSTVIRLGGLIGVLFVVDRLLPILGAG